MFAPNFTQLSRRVTKLADSIPLPTRRRRTAGTTSTGPLGPALIRGRGLARRRPRRAVPVLTWVVCLLLATAFALFALRFLG